MLLERALQKWLFLYFSVHLLASQLGWLCFRGGIQLSLSKCGSEKTDVSVPVSTADAPICHISNSRTSVLAHGVWTVPRGGPAGLWLSSVCVLFVELSGGLATQALTSRGSTWLLVSTCLQPSPGTLASCWQRGPAGCQYGNVHGFCLMGCFCAIA